MDIIKVTEQSHEGGIILPDLESVKAALQQYSRGGSTILNEGFGTSMQGGIAAIGKLTLDLGRDSRFMQALYDEIDARDYDRFGFSKSYDYDGWGPFFKTTVDVERHPSGSFILSLVAAYVGEQPCVNLATRLGLPRALHRNSVTLHVAPSGTRFAFDFDACVERLASIGLDTFTGTEIAEALMAQTAEWYNAPFDVVLRDNEDITVRFGLEQFSVEGPIDFETRELVWSNDGPILSGPLYTRFENTTPKLSLMIEPTTPPGWLKHRGYTAIDPAIREAINQQTALIADAFA